MYRLLPCIRIFRRGGGGMKSGYVKNRIGSCKKYAFRFEKGYKQISALDSCKIICLNHRLMFVSLKY